MTRIAASCTAVATVVLTAATLAGCSSSGAKSSASSSTSTTASSAASSASAAAASTTATSGTASAGNTAAACADWRGLSSLDSSVGDLGKDLPKAKVLFAALQKGSDKLAADAPASIRADSQQVASSVRVLAGAVEHAKSLSQLHTEGETQPQLKSATTTLDTEGDKVDTWAKTNCK